MIFESVTKFDQIFFLLPYYYLISTLAIMFQANTFTEAERVLEEDLKLINSYDVSWRLRPNPS